MKLHREPLLELDLFDELNKRFAVKDYYYLDKAISVLEKYKNPSAFHTIKCFKVDDFSGLEIEDFTYIFSSLNDTFPSPILRKVKMYSNDGNKGLDFVIENTTDTQVALDSLKQIKTLINSRLRFDNDIFIYKGTPLKISPETHIYKILRAIFTLTKGKSKDILYEDLFATLKKEYKGKNEEELKHLVQKYTITRGYELNRKLEKISPNAPALIETIKDIGIRFRNN